MKKTRFIVVLSFVLALSLAGCGRAREAAPEQPAVIETAEQPAPAETAEAAPPPEPTPAATWPVRQDGERFEDSIVVLGMEETVHYEHLRNEALGFEMDYDYESFRRDSNAERERFVSVWDDPGRIEDYMGVTRSTEDAETVAAALTEELSKDFDLTRVTRELERAGSCLYIEASVIKGTNQMTDQLQAYYIIPAPDGCRIAATHAFITESEGFFRRFDAMLNTLSVIDG